MASPFAPLLEAQGTVVLDGGLATELETRGQRLDDRLWSASVLLEAPETVRRLHLDYLLAGSDCVTGASYQASFEGLERRGLSHAEAGAVLTTSVRLAVEAREAFLRQPAARGRPRPLVAASVGPYGAVLADGSEYTGAHDLGVDGLADFHRERLRTLAAAGPDLLACETIPSRAEAHALARLLGEESGVPAWLSFSCRDGRLLSDGTPLATVVREVESCDRIVAVGINCTAPRHVSDLLRSLEGTTRKPIVVYPNSGEAWDGRRKRWLDEPDGGGLADQVVAWRRLGASILGGCCRTGPRDIREIRAALLGATA